MIFHLDLAYFTFSNGICRRTHYANAVDIQLVLTNNLSWITSMLSQFSKHRFYSHSSIKAIPFSFLNQPNLFLFLKSDEITSVTSLFFLQKLIKTYNDRWSRSINLKINRQIWWLCIQHNIGETCSSSRP